MPEDHSSGKNIRLIIDADACPVKEEVYKVAGRYDLDVVVVSNSRMRIPYGGRIRLQLVGDDIDEADDWIASQVNGSDIVITNDIPLASRCIRTGAQALSPYGRVFTEDNVGDVLATRDLLAHLRSTGAVTGGPSPFSPRDRSRFIERLDALIQKVVKRPKEKVGKRNSHP